MTATRDSWKVLPMPESRVQIAYTRSFDADEHRRLARGLIPEEMEDKWFIYLEEEWLRIHRSWTGLCIYEVRLRVTPLGSAVQEAWVNRDPAQYRSSDPVRDAQTLAHLIDYLLRL